MGLDLRPAKQHQHGLLCLNEIDANAHSCTGSDAIAKPSTNSSAKSDTYSNAHADAGAFSDTIASPSGSVRIVKWSDVEH
jgi:hypothetical protein